MQDKIKMNSTKKIHITSYHIKRKIIAKKKDEDKEEEKERDKDKRYVIGEWEIKQTIIAA